MHGVRAFTTRALARCWREADATAETPTPADIPQGLVAFAAARGSLGPMTDALKAWGLFERLTEKDRTDTQASLARTELFNRAMSRAVSEFLLLATDADVPVVLFKGHDIIHRYYPEHILRPTTDADILIKKQDTPEIERLLSASGFSSPGGAGSSWTRGALAIDVHTDFIDARRVTGKRHLPHIPTELIFEAAHPHTLSGAPYLSPDPYHTLILTALHALTHSYLMDYWFLDIAVVIASMGDDFSWNALVSESERYGLGFSLGPMLWALGSLFSYPMPERVLNTVRPGPFSRYLIRTATERTEYLFFGEVLLGLQVDTINKKFYYFRELLFPKREVVSRELGVPETGTVSLVFRRTAHLLSSLGRIMINALKKKAHDKSKEKGG